MEGKSGQAVDDHVDLMRGHGSNLNLQVVQEPLPSPLLLDGGRGELLGSKTFALVGFCQAMQGSHCILQQHRGNGRPNVVVILKPHLM